MIRSIKRKVARLLSGSSVAPLIRTILLGNGGTIFTLHRFAGRGLPPATLEHALAKLREHGFAFVSLQTMLDGGIDQRERCRQVAFTVDDGYADFLEVGLPIFEKHRCPVTLFAITGFLDGELWPWWDQVTYMLEHTVGRLDLVTTTGEFHREVGDRSRAAVIADLTAWLKTLPDEEKLSAIARAARQLGVAIPRQAPSEYRPLSWEQARSATQRGVTVGPHTHTHPLLPNISAQQAKAEILKSWQRLNQELADPLPIFAFPGGAFTARDVAITKRCGMRAALTTAPGHVAGGDLDDPYRLPRFDLPADELTLMQIVSGLQAAKHRVRKYVDRQ